MISLELNAENITTASNVRAVDFVTGLVTGFMLLSSRDVEALHKFNKVFVTTLEENGNKAFGGDYIAGRGGSHFWCMDKESGRRIIIIEIKGE